MTLRLLVIVGPTATGKTRLGVEVAHRLGSEIVSADSRQVYRRLDLGTGKDLDEYRKVEPPVPYHLIDVVDVTEVYTVARYLSDVGEVLARAAGERRFGSGAVPLVMVGGSGLYVEAVLKAYRIPAAPPDARLRRELEGRPRAELAERLQREAPGLAARTDLASHRRIVRALEVTVSNGVEPPDLAPADPPPARVFGVQVDRAALRRRIHDRLRQRVEAGLVDEVRELLDSGVPADRLRSLGLEYRELVSHLIDREPLEVVLRRLETRIAQLAKRQQTWFRGMPRRGIPITWVDPAAADRILAEA